MLYIEGFIIPVPASNRAAYLNHSTQASRLFKELGVHRMVEAWGDQVPDGKVTDFKSAVKAKADEVVALSWFEYPSRQARDAASEKMRNDPRMRQLGASMPFDGQRMIFAGFEAIVDEGGIGTSEYVDGFVVPVPVANKEAYREFAAAHALTFRKLGATRVVEAWGDDVPTGKVTDYRGAVQANDAENIVYSWIEWPSKVARDAAWEKMMADEGGQTAKMPFDGKRLIYGGFAKVLDI